MRSTRLATSLVFAGMLLLFAGTGLIQSLGAGWEQSNGAHGLDKVTLHARTGANGAGASGFTEEEIGRLAQAWGTAPVAYMAASRDIVRFGNTGVTGDVIGVSGSFADFHHIRLLSGSTITERAVRERSNVVVVSSRMAEALFRSLQAAGLTVRIGGQPFTVIGVYAEPNSLPERMADDGVPDVLVPVSLLLDMHPQLAATTVELVLPNGNAASGAAAAVNAALNAAGKQPAQFTVANDALQYRLLRQKKAIALFVCGAAAMAALLRLLAGELNRMRTQLRASLRAYDLADALRLGRRPMLKLALAVGGLAACMAAIWLLVRFRLYIPAAYIPDELIDASFYGDLIRSAWQSRIAGLGDVPDRHQLAAARISELSDWLLAIAAFAGAPLLWLGAREWAMRRPPLPSLLVRTALAAPIAAALTFAAARAVGLPYAVDWREAAVIWGMGLCTAGYFRKKWMKDETERMGL